MGNFTVRDSLSPSTPPSAWYGCSRRGPEALVAWEAQFGDFVRQTPDHHRRLSSRPGESGQRAGLVLLLRTGARARGRSTRRPGLSASSCVYPHDNMRVTVPSTAAQCFHLLRSARTPTRSGRVRRDAQSMLRTHSARRSPRLETGTFRHVIDDDSIEDPAGVRRIVLATGRSPTGEAATGGTCAEEARQRALVGWSSSTPWPEPLLSAVSTLSRATELVWLQEEPENMGAWSFVHSGSSTRACPSTCGSAT